MLLLVLWQTADAKCIAVCTRLDHCDWVRWLRLSLLSPERVNSHRKPALKLSPAPTVLMMRLAGIACAVKSIRLPLVKTVICPAPAVNMKLVQ